MVCSNWWYWGLLYGVRVGLNVEIELLGLMVVRLCNDGSGCVGFVIGSIVVLCGGRGSDSGGACSWTGSCVVYVLV